MPEKVVLYVDQNDFTTQFLNALQPLWNINYFGLNNSIKLIQNWYKAGKEIIGSNYSKSYEGWLEAGKILGQLDISFATSEGIIGVSPKNLYNRAKLEIKQGNYLQGLYSE